MLIVEKQPKSIVTETYKALRTNIEYSSYDKDLKVILVTSSQPQEGKTTTTVNLALSLAQDDKKVVVVDCDLRKPSIHKIFSVSNSKGLTEIILGKKDIKEVAISYKDNLDVIPSGKVPPNPSEMLGSENMKKLLATLDDYYDYVILDTPPINAVADAQILATKVDGVIFVVRAGSVKKDNILQAKNQLDKVNAQIIGTVLNDIDTKYNKNQYYYYYDGDDAKSGKRKKKGRH